MSIFKEDWPASYPLKYAVTDVEAEQKSHKRQKGNDYYSQQSER